MYLLCTNCIIIREIQHCEIYAGTVTFSHGPSHGLSTKPAPRAFCLVEELKVMRHGTPSLMELDTSSAEQGSQMWKTTTRSGLISVSECSSLMRTAGFWNEICFASHLSLSRLLLKEALKAVVPGLKKCAMLSFLQIAFLASVSSAHWKCGGMELLLLSRLEAIEALRSFPPIHEFSRLYYVIVVIVLDDYCSIIITTYNYNENIDWL